jgi:spore photoproduct lyase
MSKTSGVCLEEVSFHRALKTIAVDENIRRRDKIRAVLKRAEKYKIPVAEVENTKDEKNIRKQKNCLHLTQTKKRFIKRWPSPEQIVGEDEWCLLPVEGCCVDCCYCYLQGYLSRHSPTASMATDEMLAQLNNFFTEKNNEQKYHFSLGELSDGLYLEPLLDIIPPLWDFFRSRSALLEIRTKSHHIHGLSKKLSPHPRAAFCWTLTPGETAEKIELFASPFKQRIAAMRHMLDHGFRVGVRLDPLILTENWQDCYKKMIGKLQEHIDLKELSYIVAGTFRFPAGFDRVMQKRFPGCDFLYDEMVKGPDGKYRYPRSRRLEAYRTIKEMLGESGHDLTLCMEPDYMWDDCGIKK